MEYYLALLAFTFASSATPGPNNLMLLASGLNHGIESSLSHYFGVAFGFSSMVLLIGVGLGALVFQFPEVFLSIKILGVSYLLFLAWKIANTGRPSASAGSPKPLRFFEAAAFQWVNPKAWVIGVSGIATFTLPGRLMETAVTVALAFLLTSVSGAGMWLVAGRHLQRFLTEDKELRLFNITMAALLVVSIIPIVF